MGNRFWTFINVHFWILGISFKLFFFQKWFRALCSKIRKLLKKCCYHKIFLEKGADTIEDDVKNYDKIVRNVIKEVTVYKGD